MKTSRIFVLTSLACLLALPLTASDSPDVYRDYCVPADEAIVAVPQSEAGIWYFADDDTGELRRRVVAEQAKAGSLNWSSAGLTVLVQPDGTKTVDLEGRFMTDFVIGVEDGKIIEGCVDRPDAQPQMQKWEEQ